MNKLALNLICKINCWNEIEKNRIVMINSTIAFEFEMKKQPFRSGFSQRDRRLNVESRLFFLYTEHAVANFFFLSFSLSIQFASQCCCVVHCFIICFDDDNKLMQSNYYYRCVELFVRTDNFWKRLAQFFTFVRFLFPARNRTSTREKSELSISVDRLSVTEKNGIHFSIFAFHYLFRFAFESNLYFEFPHGKHQTIYSVLNSKKIRLALLLL